MKYGLENVHLIGTQKDSKLKESVYRWEEQTLAGLGNGNEDLRHAIPAHDAMIQETLPTMYNPDSLKQMQNERSFNKLAKSTFAEGKIASGEMPSYFTSEMPNQSLKPSDPAYFTKEELQYYAKKDVDFNAFNQREVHGQLKDEYPHVLDEAAAHGLTDNVNNYLQMSHNREHRAGYGEWVASSDKEIASAISMHNEITNIASIHTDENGKATTMADVLRNCDAYEKEKSPIKDEKYAALAQKELSDVAKAWTTDIGRRDIAMGVFDNTLENNPTNKLAVAKKFAWDGQGNFSDFIKKQSIEKQVPMMNSIYEQEGVLPQDRRYFDAKTGTEFISNRMQDIAQNVDQAMANARQLEKQVGGTMVFSRMVSEAEKYAGEDMGAHNALMSLNFRDAQNLPPSFHSTLANGVQYPSLVRNGKIKDIDEKTKNSIWEMTTEKIEGAKEGTFLSMARPEIRSFVGYNAIAHAAATGDDAETSVRKTYDNLINSTQVFISDNGQRIMAGKYGMDSTGKQYTMSAGEYQQAFQWMRSQIAPMTFGNDDPENLTPEAFNHHLKNDVGYFEQNTKAMKRNGIEYPKGQLWVFKNKTSNIIPSVGEKNAQPITFPVNMSKDFSNLWNASHPPTEATYAGFGLEKVATF
jgi:hypothetical protein